MSKMPEVKVRVPRPKVSALLRAALAELEGRGVHPTPDEIVWLNSLAEKQVLPSVEDPPAFLSPPIRVGPALFYPPTVQALMWLDRYGYEWWEGEDDLVPVAFALAHSGPNAPADLFPGLVNRRAARARVWAWGFRLLVVSRARVRWACSRLLGYETVEEIDATGLKAPGGEEEAGDWGDVISYLCAAYHQPPEYFLRCSANVAARLLRDLPKVNPMAQYDPAEDPLRKMAFIHFRLAIRHIARLHTPAPAPGPDTPAQAGVQDPGGSGREQTVSTGSGSGPAGSPPGEG